MPCTKFLIMPSDLFHLKICIISETTSSVDGLMYYLLLNSKTPNSDF